MKGSSICQEYQTMEPHCETTIPQKGEIINKVNLSEINISNYFQRIFIKIVYVDSSNAQMQEMYVKSV